jgi:hypothetical protein
MLTLCCVACSAPNDNGDSSRKLPEAKGLSDEEAAGPLIIDPTTFSSHWAVDDGWEVSAWRFDSPTTGHVLLEITSQYGGRLAWQTWCVDKGACNWAIAIRWNVTAAKNEDVATVVFSRLSGTRVSPESTFGVRRELLGTFTLLDPAKKDVYASNATFVDQREGFPGLLGVWSWDGEGSARDAWFDDSSAWWMGSYSSTCDSLAETPVRDWPGPTLFLSITFISG